MIEPSAPKNTSRRTLVRGASWSLPVAVAAAAAPTLAASSASCPSPVTRTRTVQAPTSNVNTVGPLLSQAWLVPPGVTQISFEVLGGGGGDADTSGSGLDLKNVGGDGALVTGTMMVTPGETLTLLAGNGGIGREGFNFGRMSGGLGYGRGGDTEPRPGATSRRLSGASGGGGSAILRGTQPVVVAGGGGGGSNVGGILTGNYPPVAGTGGDGGNAAQNGGNGEDQTIQQPPGMPIAEGGGGATGDTPGQPRGTASSVRAAKNTDKIVGKPGTFTAAGGNGGDGVTTPTFYVNDSTSSSGGGGGYAGGASGTTVIELYVVSGSNYYVMGAGGAGGAGSSYVDPTAVTGAAYALGGNGAKQAGIRPPGQVTITWEECPPA